MKKSLLLAFTLSLFFVLFFSSCARTRSDYEPRIEFIEHSYVALKPSNINNNSYKNPRNIFLEIKSLRDADTEMTANWYKKTNGVYQIFSLNDTGRKLNENLAYEIADTVHLSKEIGEYRNTHLDEVDLAYQGQVIVLKKIVKRDHLGKYLWAKMEVTSKDSVLKYNPETKSFFTTTTYQTTKLKTDFGPIIIFVIFLLLSLSILFRDKINWLKKTREKIFRYDYIGIHGNDHQLNSLLLFIITTVFVFVYCLYMEVDDYILFSILLGLLARLIFWLDKIKTKLIEKTSLSIILVACVYAMLVSSIGMPKIFSYITTAIVALPGLLNIFLLEIKEAKQKKSKETKAWYDKIES